MVKKIIVFAVAALLLLVVGMSLGKIVGPEPSALKANSIIGVIEVNGVIAGDASTSLLGERQALLPARLCKIFDWLQNVMILKQ